MHQVAVRIISLTKHDTNVESDYFHIYYNFYLYQSKNLLEKKQVFGEGQYL